MSSRTVGSCNCAQSIGADFRQCLTGDDGVVYYRQLGDDIERKLPQGVDGHFDRDGLPTFNPNDKPAGPSQSFNTHWMCCRGRRCRAWLRTCVVCIPCSRRERCKLTGKVLTQSDPALRLDLPALVAGF